MPDTIISRSNEGDSINVGHDLTEVEDWDIDIIKYTFDEYEIDDLDASDAWRRHKLVTEWFQWCVHEYPDAKSEQDLSNLVLAAGEDVDIRLLTRGEPIAGYSILLFLEACYAVDEALCGTDTEALEKVKVWHMPQEMGAYKYLMTKEMILWWTSELTELENEVKSPSSSRVSLSCRIGELNKCYGKLEAIMQSGEGIWTNIWTTMSASINSTPPAGFDDAIGDRVRILKTSVGILSKALERSQRDDASSMTTPARSPDLGGIRRRVPRRASQSANEHHLGIAQASGSNEETVALDVAASIGVAPLIGATIPLLGPQYLLSMFVIAMSRAKQLFVIRYKASELVAWLGHGETACIVTICSVVISSIFLGWSAFLTKTQSATSCDRGPVADPNFLGNISQSVLSILSVYLVIATAIQTRSVGLRYKSWFWLWLSASVLLNVAGLSLYSASPLASVVLLWAAAFAQVVIPLLLVVKTRPAAARNGDDVELHGE